MTKTINNLVVVSDLHIGCGLGLCHPDGCKLEVGGTYHPSRLQLVVWGWWREFWERWVPMIVKGEPYAVCINGDAIDGGAHHGNTTHIAANPDDEREHARRILKPDRKSVV